MNNYYTLTYLNRELKEKICTGFFQFAISPHKNVVEFYINKDSERYRLVFSTNPSETAIFLDNYRPPKKSNVIYFFEGLGDQRIISLSLAKHDRLFNIHFEDGQELTFKLFSSNPNVFLVDDGIIKDAFKNPDELIGKDAPEPFPPTFKHEVSPRKNAKNQITAFNPLLPRNLLPYVIDEHEVDEMNVQQVESFTKQITDALETEAHPRVLTTGDLCLWSQDILDKPNDRVFDVVNDAVLHAYRNAVHLRRLHNKKEGVQQLLERTVSKKESQLKQLKQADKSLERADEYEKYGHLLMSHAHETIQPDTEEITVDDFYEENEPITIPLKQGKSITDNAEYYYDKAKSSRRSFKEAKRRIPTTQKELKQSKDLLTQLNEIKHLPELESWMKDHKEELNKFGYGVEDDSQATSPYRKFKEGKYEIWIGKNAKSNDELTTLAHKEDIWLHARGVGGSHVVIRMGNQQDYPPKTVILKAASYAAYYSKAKGMKSAPVIYTKRKYVRKPKGAAPGAVKVEREQVELVPPLNPNKRTN